MQQDEFPRFFESLDQELNHDIRDYVYLSLFTGARKSNILSMRWDELNFEQAINGSILHIIGKSLGHKSLTATQIYSRLTDDPVRDSMSEAVKSMRGWSG